MQGTEGELPFLGVRGPEDPGATPCVDPVAEAPPGRVCGRVLVLELVQVLEAHGVRDEALDLVEVRLRGGLEVDEALFVVPVPRAVVAELQRGRQPSSGIVERSGRERVPEGRGPDL